MKKGTQIKAANVRHGKLFTALLITTLFVQAFITFSGRTTFISLLLNLALPLIVLCGMWFWRKAALYVFFTFILIVTIMFSPWFILPLMYESMSISSLVSYTPLFLLLLFIIVWIIAIKSEWHRFDKKQHLNGSTNSVALNAITIATCAIYFTTMLLYILQMLTVSALYTQFPITTEINQLQFDDLTIESVRQLMTAWSYNGMVSGVFFVLFLTVHAYAGWLVVKKSQNYQWFYTMIPSSIVIAAGFLSVFPDIQYSFIGQILSRPYQVPEFPYLFLVPLLASFLGGMVARHVTLRIK